MAQETLEIGKKRFGDEINIEYWKETTRNNCGYAYLFGIGFGERERERSEGGWWVNPFVLYLLPWLLSFENSEVYRIWRRKKLVDLAVSIVGFSNIFVFFKSLI